MLIWTKIICSRTFVLAGLLVIVATNSACGYRGPLYLEHEDESQAQPGHELTQDATRTSDKQDEKERETGKKDKKDKQE